MCTLLISIWFLLGAIFGRNHYLSMMHPKGCYFNPNRDRPKVIFDSGIFIVWPLLILVTLSIRGTGWNWREHPNFPFDPPKGYGKRFIEVF